jgi:hypothetical protein
MDKIYLTPSPQPEPPEGFIDNTVKVFRLNPDGSKGELVRTMEAFPEGWDDPARRRLTPGSGARNQKEDEEMARPRREPPPVETLRALYEKYDAKIQPIAIELDATWMMARRWLREAGIIEQKQTPTPEPTQAANQEPEREEAESATQSVAQEEPETYDEICPPQDTTLDEMKLIWIEDVMEHCVTVEIKMRYIEAIAGLRV